MIYITNGEPLVPAFFIFGDSIVDVGKNNNNLHTAVKSNFFPIGWLFEARKAFVGTGLLEVAILCNLTSIGTCVDASKYVFWNSFHPTEATNKILMDHLIPAATSPLYILTIKFASQNIVYFH
ncbi:GDSL-like lipase/acylhydrolase superfamily protein, putative [Medicago truncatula]|uniref:GDSL-like lipase/acylhydrolase superfamily protein, putative n=1 Tax=Medicago truncatula TaxID=3880 RepID=A0A072UKL3_MEDTR|nr:GDSL-like lipase/acylhydrolase superfamily protein, putative [Medicago truncatula]